MGLQGRLPCLLQIGSAMPTCPAQYELYSYQGPGREAVLQFTERTTEYLQAMHAWEGDADVRQNQAGVVTVCRFAIQVLQNVIVHEICRKIIIDFISGLSKVC